MDILKSKTVTLLSGFRTVPCGVSQSKIIKVSRQGEQKDYSSLVFGTSGSEWSFLSPTKKIIFLNPADEDELIHIIYKL